MKRPIIAMALLAVLNCKEAPKQTTATSEERKMEMEAPKKEYPEALTQVFDAHGGLDNWKKKRNLTFTISKPDATEVQTIDLYNRTDKIEMPATSMGFDGDEIWLLDPETHQMAWLGYTFRFGSNEKSEDVSYIRYADWMNVGDVMLPKILTWYTSEGRAIKEAKDPVPFENVSLSEIAKHDDFYQMPENATVFK